MAHTLQRIVSMIAIGAVLGLLSNAFLPKGIPLVTPPKKVPKPEEFIPLAKAHELWSAGTALLLDARAPEDYAAGHIANAFNLPAESYQEHFPRIAPLLTPSNPVIVYCEGVECELSHRLADELRGQGFTNIHILYNGWTAWQEKGFPTETGTRDETPVLPAH